MRPRRIVALRVEYAPRRVEVALHAQAHDEQRGIGLIHHVPDLVAGAEEGVGPDRVRHTPPDQRTTAETMDHDDGALVWVVLVE